YHLDLKKSTTKFNLFQIICLAFLRSFSLKNDLEYHIKISSNGQGQKDKKIFSHASVPYISSIKEKTFF
ncbi:hypothetical protein, partial [Pediococcus cellicola]|uniref:hypothetical protein n=1 Tax=Pediococcus cellicola TaxID=319652 RepID=UPI001F1BBDA6